jgi:predicted Zn-dependent protease with MMP-like domain/DnaJ-domain-containing protein 1
MYWMPDRTRDPLPWEDTVTGDPPHDPTNPDATESGDSETAGAAEASPRDDALGGDLMDEDAPADDDYYAVLGIAPGASAAAIRQAFRRQAMRWHPDHFATASPERQAYAAERMRAILAAQRALGDPLRRHLYDRRRLATLSVGGHAGTTYAREAVFRETESRGGNDNPVGMLFGILSVIVVVGLVGRILTALDNGPGTLLSVVLIMFFATLAALFFARDSALARAAHSYVAGEPRMEEEVVPASLGKTPFVEYTTDEDEPSLSHFEMLVDEALAGVPDEFQPYLDNVVVRVKDEPTDDELRRMKLRPCSLLLGLYEGVPLIHQGAYGVGPEMVTIFRHPIEEYCGGDEERIRHQVRATVLHELAHHFGMDHDAMPAWIK